jgi:hypothetical protein
LSLALPIVVFQLAGSALAAVTVRIGPEAQASRPGACSPLVIALRGGAGAVVAARTVELRVRPTSGDPSVSFCRPRGGGRTVTGAVSTTGLLRGEVTTGSAGRARIGVRADDVAALAVKAFVDKNGNDRVDAGESRATSFVAVGMPACNDGVDNEGDGRADHPGDRGCRSKDDASEKRTIRKRSRATLSYGGRRHAFRGRVGSARPKCVRSRKVVVKKLRPGRDQTVGRDRTNRKGRWSVPRKHAHGRFYAKAKRKSFVAKNGDRVVCKAKRTRWIRVS